MLDRNRRIKKQPEKFQHCTEQFDIIITAEERVYDQVTLYHLPPARVTILFLFMKQYFWNTI